MLNSIRGVVTTILLCLNLALWGTSIFLLGLIRILTPTARARRRLILAGSALADCWVGGNNRISDLMLNVRWDIERVEGLDTGGHYLIMSNHVSWLDILALFRAFHRRTPFIRFFLKRELIWFPIAGQACWALQFPFMKRYSAEYLAKHPAKRGEDLAATRRACRRYRRVPATILNFLEGTRFTDEKHTDQESPYRHLLRPRVGGVGFVLASMGEQLDSLLDVTIAYPGHETTFWGFVTGHVREVRIRARRLEIPEEFFTAAVTEPGEVRDRFKEWVDSIWRDKDALLDTLT